MKIKKYFTNKGFSNEDSDKLFNFINGNMTNYQFKNFIDICKIADHAIMLCKIDLNIQALFYKNISLIETRLHNELVKSINKYLIKNKLESYFWNDNKNIRNDFQRKINGKESKWCSLKNSINKSLKNIIKKNEKTDYVDIEKVLYNISFGKFKRYFGCLVDEVKGDMLRSYKMNFKEMEYNLEVIRKIRNRISHCSHILNKRMYNDFNKGIKDITDLFKIMEKYMCEKMFNRFLLDFKNIIIPHKEILYNYTQETKISNEYLNSLKE